MSGVTAVANAVDVAYMDRLDYVSMLCNELVYTQCVEAWLTASTASTVDCITW